MILTLCELRNGYVYESLELGDREIEIATNAMKIIEDWWEIMTLNEELKI